MMRMTAMNTERHNMGVYGIHWQAYVGDYDLGVYVGSGPTESDAIADALDHEIPMPIEVRI